MGLFKDIYCTECKMKTKLLFRTKLCDGNYLCSECTSIVPQHMRSSFTDKYTLEDYHDFKRYLEFTNKEYRKLFHETNSYYKIHIDAEHKLFYIGYGIDDNTVFYDFSFVTSFDLDFKAENYKDGVLGQKVTGKIIFAIGVGYPKFYYQDVLDSSAKAKAKTSFFGNKISYENPKDMDDFIYYFNHAWESALNEYEEKSNTYEGYDDVDTSVQSELKQALSLFMIDDIKDVSLNDLKALRNRLIKTFHPDIGNDNDTKYAQKINQAYEIIKAHLK